MCTKVTRARLGYSTLTYQNKTMLMTRQCLDTGNTHDSHAQRQSDRQHTHANALDGSPLRTMTVEVDVWSRYLFDLRDIGGALSLCPVQLGLQLLLLSSHLQSDTKDVDGVKAKRREMQTNWQHRYRILQLHLSRVLRGVNHTGW